MPGSLFRAGAAALAVACVAAQAGPTPDPTPKGKCVLQGQGATYDLTILTGQPDFLIKNSRNTGGAGDGQQWCVCVTRVRV